MGKIVRMIRKLICYPIKIYQYMIGPCLKPSCRFYPSCSLYALQAIEHFGVFKGIYLACGRLLKCHPWSRGGYDPVITTKEKK